MTPATTFFITFEQVIANDKICTVHFEERCEIFLGDLLRERAPRARINSMLDSRTMNCLYNTFLGTQLCVDRIVTSTESRHQSNTSL